MRLLYFVLPAAVGLLAGCAERMPATEARVALQVGHIPAARRVVEGRGHASEGPKGHASAAPNGRASEAPNIDLNKICRAVEQSDEPTQDRHRWCQERVAAAMARIVGSRSVRVRAVLNGRRRAELCRAADLLRDHFRGEDRLVRISDRDAMVATT